MEARVRKIFLVGHYGGANTGDDAMLYGCLSELRRFGLDVTVVSKSTGGALFQKLGTNPVKPKFFSVIKAINSADWVVLGGGTHYHDDYKLFRLLRHIRYLTVLTSVFVFSKLVGKRIALISMGFGPFRTKVVRLLFKIVLRIADFIAVRDNRSLAEVQCRGMKAKVLYAFDLSACLLNELKLDKLEAEGVENVPVLGISPTKLHLGEKLVGCDSNTFWSILAKEVEKVVKPKGIKVHLFEFRGGRRESDGELVSLMERELGVAGVKVEKISYQQDPLTMLRYVQRCHWFVASRFHSSVFAYLAQVPQIIIPYHQKLVDFAFDIGLEVGMVPLERPGWPEVFRNKLLSMISEPERFTARVPITWACESAKQNFEFLEMSIR